MQIIQLILLSYDNLLVYHSNIFFLLLPIVFFALGYSAYRILMYCVGVLPREIRFRKKWKRVQNTYNRGKKQVFTIVRAIEKEVLIDE